MILDSSSINSGKCESCYNTEMKMDYTSNTLLLAVLLFASAVAVKSQDSLCKSMVEKNGYVCEEHKVSTMIAWFLVYKAFSLCVSY